MNPSYLVFRMQITQLKREKGMLGFYCFCIAVIGIVIPIFFNIDTVLITTILFTVVFLKPILSDSLAGERERKTFESLLSTTLYAKDILWGKFLFSFLFAVVFYMITFLLSILTSKLSGYELKLEAWQWLCIIGISILDFAAVSISGIYKSAISADLRTANSKISFTVYMFGLFLMVYLSVILLGDALSSLLIGAVLIMIYLFLLFLYTIKITKMKQFDCFEDEKKKEAKKEHKNIIGFYNPKKRSPFGGVFLHELKYLLTLKILLLNFLFLCFAPIIAIGFMKYYFGGVNLNYAVLLTAVIMPRTPTNLIAYSIGGEKVYKTGESLLSVPISLKAVFCAKCAVPILVSAIMLLLSSLITWLGANLIGRIFESGMVYHYSFHQLVLLFPVGVLSCLTMVFITGILSVSSKSPRQGLYISSILGIIFVIPPLIIITLTKTMLMWSFFYLIFLVIGNSICFKCMMHKIGRPQIMSRL